MFLMLCTTNCPASTQYVEEGKLRPEVVVSHRLPLSEAAHGYQIFNDKSDECLKVNRRRGPAETFESESTMGARQQQHNCRRHLHAECSWTWHIILDWSACAAAKCPRTLCHSFPSVCPIGKNRIFLHRRIPSGIPIAVQVVLKPSLKPHSAQTGPGSAAASLDKLAVS